MAPKLIVLLTRKPGLDRETFRRELAERHPAFAWERLPEEVAAGIERYVQSHSRGKTSQYDCVTEITFRDAAALAAWNEWYLSPAAAAVREDEERAVDVARRVAFVTEEVPTPQPGATRQAPKDTRVP